MYCQYHDLSDLITDRLYMLHTNHQCHIDASARTHTLYRPLACYKLKLVIAVVAIPDPAAPFELIKISSGFGIGAVLMQNSRLVAFCSRKMTDPKRNYVNHVLAANNALEVIRCYLLGNHFILITDNKPDTYLDSQPTLSRRQAR